MDATPQVLPELERVEETLVCLFGRQVVVSPAKLKLRAKKARVFAAYIDDDDELAAMWTANAEAAGYLGAALSMLPVAVAREATRARSLSDVIRENLYEVVNIFANLFDSPGAPHIRLDRLVTSKDGLADAATALLRKPRSQLDLQIDIAGYGAGQIAFVI